MATGAIAHGRSKQHAKAAPPGHRVVEKQRGQKAQEHDARDLDDREVDRVEERVADGLVGEQRE